ncbi:uncharacterized protein si:dkey-30j10.5 [Coregonus clupeaformis]|uniref:uncharacterized protein si:dkey-30j10.5 n=1 Tax=Coregonus clupeaformis TaxID=59861 RepID=UPI001BDFCBAD|nr:uncharacterized protein si:dkey-30j10.5 [Coregonus clupeaformis]
MASKYITDIAISTSPAREQQLRGQGFLRKDFNLNQGNSSTSIVYMWYKMGNVEPITRVQFSFSDAMKNGLRSAGYTELQENLNYGAEGDVIQLWYCSGASPKYDIPIVDLLLSTNVAAEFKYGWERLPCNLNRNNSGENINLWLKRESETYICDVATTTSFQEDINLFKTGYIRLDEDLNRGAGGNWIYLWYRQSTDKGSSLTKIDVSINQEQELNLQQRGFTSLNVNLNEGTCGQSVFVWFHKDESSPIKALTVQSDDNADVPYEEIGLVYIGKNLNAGNNGVPLFIWYGY